VRPTLLRKARNDLPASDSSRPFGAREPGPPAAELDPDKGRHEAAPDRAILMFGVSSTPICGVRDYAETLGAALEHRGVRVSSHWCQAGPDITTDVRSWVASLDTVVKDEQPDWLLWHYSVFTLGPRGIPVLAPLVARRAARTAPPLVGLLHEYAYPLGKRAARGAVQAVSHRLALSYVYRLLDAAIVTTDRRVTWLQGRRWLPEKPLAFLPVCADSAFDLMQVAARRDEGFAIGVIGFGSDHYLIDPVVQAFARVHEHLPGARLVLVGAPGPAHPLAERWWESAARHGVSQALSFSGLLTASAYARAVADLDVVVFPDTEGPTARKTTLAAGLAAGKPTIALDGPRPWQRLVDEGAVTIVRPEAGQIAEQLLLLEEDPREWRERAERARAFYERWQAPDVLAERLLGFLESIPSRPVGAAGR
jgi:glycosyltransferase involved in cell wall biosynthesis